jgi:hypothetical protein
LAISFTRFVTLLRGHTPRHADGSAHAAALTRRHLIVAASDNAVMPDTPVRSRRARHAIRSYACRHDAATTRDDRRPFVVRLPYIRLR